MTKVSQELFFTGQTSLLQLHPGWPALRSADWTRRRRHDGTFRALAQVEVHGFGFEFFVYVETSEGALPGKQHEMGSAHVVGERGGIDDELVT